MTFIGIKATAIQAIFEYTRKKATLFLKYIRKKTTLFLEYTGKKATLFLKYTSAKDTLFYHEPHFIYNHPIGTNPIWCPIKNQYDVMIQNLSSELCFGWGFTRTFPGNQDVAVK